MSKFFKEIKREMEEIVEDMKVTSLYKDTKKLMKKLQRNAEDVATEINRCTEDLTDEISEEINDIKNFLFKP